jgi:outer membrane protein TolC
MNRFFLLNTGRKLCGWLALAACAGAAGAQAQTAGSREGKPTRILSMQDCIQIALEHNLDIQIQRYNSKIAFFGLEGAYGAWDPNVTIGGNHYFDVENGGYTSQGLELPTFAFKQDVFSAGLSGTAPSGLTYSFASSLSQTYGGQPKDSSGSIGVGNLSQPLLKNLWIDGNRLTIEVDKNRLKYNEIGIRQQVITTVTTVKQAYYDLVADIENIRVNKQAVALAQQLLDNNRRQVELVSMAPLDAKQAESQLAQSQGNLLAAQQTLVEQQNLMKTLLTDNFSAWALVEIVPSERLLAIPEITDLQDSWRAALKKRPDLLQAKLDLERIGIQLKYDRNQLFPDIEVMGGYQINGNSQLVPGLGGGQVADVFNQFSNGNLPSYQFGASISFPLSNIAARNRLKQDKMNKAQLALQYKKVEQSALAAIANDVKKIDNTLGQVESSRKAREYADQALQGEQKKFENGTSTVFVVLQLQNNLTTARFAEIQALDSYNKALDQLASDTATTIERNHITIEAR